MSDNRKVRAIPNVSFEEIGGIGRIIHTIREVIELPLRYPELFKYMGIKPHKGILLYGPPGNGKTMIAKAIANEVKAHFIAVSGPELLSKMHGESESNLRKVFQEAREMAPSIVFFDEIDAIAQRRSYGENGRLDSKFVNQLLALMDGFDSYENVTVLASTNRPELLDQALMRPGRFDYKIEIANPDKEACFDIFKVCTRKMPLSNQVDKEQFAYSLLGLSGAEISFVAQEGGYNALRRSFDLEAVIKNEETQSIQFDGLEITAEDLEEAHQKARNIHNQMEDKLWSAKIMNLLEEDVDGKPTSDKPATNLSE